MAYAAPGADGGSEVSSPHLHQDRILVKHKIIKNAKSLITSHFAIAIRPSALLALGLLGRKNLGDQGMPPPHLSTYVRALKMIPHSYFSYEYVYLSPGYS